MRLVFLCGSFEIGKDGVGDYARRLAGELTRQGNTIAAISLNDKYVDLIWEGFQKDGNDTIKVLRLPSIYSWNIRLKKAIEFISAFDPEWLSLQYVPFSYHNKGLPFLLNYRLQALSKGRKWHIMFHELWVGVKGQMNTKEYVTQLLQKMIIYCLIKKLSPALITTSIPLYRNALRGYPVKILPLFSNIPITAPEKRNVLKNDEVLKVVQFGSFTNNLYSFKEQVQWIKSYANKNSKRPFFVSVGNGGPAKSSALAIVREIIGDHSVKEMGELPPDDISELLLQSDIGISRSDYDYYGKSGSTLAMLEHGLPVILRGKRPESMATTDVFAPQLLFASDHLEGALQKMDPKPVLPQITSCLIEYLTEATVKKINT